MYKSVAQKRQSGSFCYFTANSVDTLWAQLRELSSDRYCFRGQRNALWEIVSSAQRAWNNWRCKQCLTGSVDYQSYLSLSFEYAKEHVEFPACDIKCRKTGLRDHERWGHLQHYSWPTPLIDFTNDFRVALFMAVRSLPHTPLNGHFSIYAIRPLFADGEENIDLDELVIENGGEEELYEFRNWQEKKSFIIHKDDGHWCPEISRGRMASQGGLFVYLKSENESLEKLFAQKHLMDCGKSDSADEEHDRIICVDVPYAIVNDVKAYLLDEGINAHSLGLQDDSRDKLFREFYKRFEMEFLNR